MAAPSCRVCSKDAYFTWPFNVTPKQWHEKGLPSVALCERCSTILSAILMLERGEGFFNFADEPHVEAHEMLERTSFVEKCSVG